MTAPVQQCRPDIEHTPTPWYRNANSFGAQFIYGNDIEISRSGKGYSKLVCGGDMPVVLTEANAAFIVEAVNSHAALKSRVEELTKALQHIADNDWGYVSPTKYLDPSRVRADIEIGHNVPYMGEWAVAARRALAPSLEGRGGAT